MFKRISIILLILFTILTIAFGASATSPGLFVLKDADNTYIDYVDADGTSIMKIDDTDGVTIASYTASTTYSSMSITSTTDATSLTTGSFKTAGGAAIADQLWLGDDIDMSTNTTGVYDITLKDGQADGLSIVAGTTDMVVFTTSTDAITITPPLTVTGAITNDSTTDTSSGTTGAIQTDGGIGIAKALYVGTTSRLVGAVTCDAAVSLDDTTDTSSGTTGSLHTDGGVGIAKNLYVGVNATVVGTSQLTGAVTVSSDGGGSDVTIYGDTASYRILFDADGDTNGALYVGADTYGLAFELFGDVTGCGVFWNPTTDTNGTLTIGGSGGSKGVDVVMYGDTNAKYWKWDQSADGVVLVGTLTMTGAPTITGNMQLTGTLTVGVDATGHDVIFYGDTTAYNFTYDQNQDTNGGFTNTGTSVMTGAVTITGATGITGDVTLASTSKLYFLDTGLYIYSSANGVLDIVSDTTLTITSPAITITGASTQTGALTVGVSDTGHDVIFYGATADNYFHWDESGDDLLIVGTATKVDIAGTTDSTSVTTGALSVDGGMGLAKSLFIGGNISIATGKKITTTAELTLNSVDPLTIQIGGVDWLQMDEAAISGFAAAADTAGHAVYIESEDGGADSGAATGMAGGAVSIKTGDGSASATATAVGGAGGAFSITTGAGLTGNTTGDGGVGGAIAITAGAGGASGAGAGVGGTGGSITLTAGAGGGAGGGTAGAPGKVDIAAGLLHMAVQTIDMSDTTVVLTLVPGTPAGTLVTGNILYVDANGAGAEVLKLPHEADGDGALLVIVNTGGETITIQNDAAGAVLSLETANTAFLVCDGTTWRGAVCVP